MPNAIALRTKKLQEYDLEYPFWIFDINEPSWPRKLSPFTFAPRPARILGWYAWHWEYGTDIRKFDDGPLDVVGVVDNSRQHIKPGRSISSFLNDLRYDDTFEAGTFLIVIDKDEGHTSGQPKPTTSKSTYTLSLPLEDWIFDDNTTGYRSDKCIVRIKRSWDDVTVWERDSKLDLLSDPDNRVYTAHGAAWMVHSDEELIRTTRICPTDVGDRIRKATVELIDDQTQVNGILYPARRHDHHGLTLGRGPTFKHNFEVLAGTALEGAPWTDVERYVEDSIHGGAGLRT